MHHTVCAVLARARLTPRTLQPALCCCHTLHTLSFSPTAGCPHPAWATHPVCRHGPTHPASKPALRARPGHGAQCLGRNTSQCWKATVTIAETSITHTHLSAGLVWAGCWTGLRALCQLTQLRESSSYPLVQGGVPHLALASRAQAERLIQYTVASSS